MNTIMKELMTIARKQLSIYSLETRKSDSLDFHEVSVWGVKEALIRAYVLGRFGLDTYDEFTNSINEYIGWLDENEDRVEQDLLDVQMGKMHVFEMEEDVFAEYRDWLNEGRHDCDQL